MRHKKYYVAVSITVPMDIIAQEGNEGHVRAVAEERLVDFIRDGELTDKLSRGNISPRIVIGGHADLTDEEKAEWEA